MATNKLPKQILPKEVVKALTKLPIIPAEQQLVASSGENHQLPTVPATVTWVVF